MLGTEEGGLTMTSLSSAVPVVLFFSWLQFSTNYMIVPCLSQTMLFFLLTYILMIEIWKMPSLLFQANGAAEHQSNWMRLLSVAPSLLG